MNNTIRNLSLVFSLVCLLNCKATKNVVEQTEPKEIVEQTVVQESVEYSELKDTALVNLIHSKITEFPSNTQFSVAVLKKGVPYYYGAKNESGSAQKIRNNQDGFEIGSITKVFTTHLMVDQILSGKIKLEDNINDLLSLDLHCAEPISLKQLATHSSGLPVMPDSFWDSGYEEQNPYKDFGQDDLIQYLENEIAVDTASVNKFRYSNIGMSILGYTLQDLTKRSYESLMQGVILSPLEMTNTSFDKTKLQNGLVDGLKPNGKVGQNWDMDGIKPAGGMYSTSEDLVKYLESCMQDGNESFTFQSQSIYKRNKSTDQALGWMIINSKSGNKYYFHAGGTGTFSTIMVMNPSSQNAVVLLSNIETEDSSIDLFGFKLMKELNALD